MIGNTQHQGFSTSKQPRRDGESRVLSVIGKKDALGGCGEDLGRYLQLRQNVCLCYHSGNQNKRGKKKSEKEKGKGRGRESGVEE